LVIGHFSARYKDLQPVWLEAKEIFPNTYLAQEGETFTLQE
jgi:ribonuclease Z